MLVDALANFGRRGWRHGWKQTTRLTSRVRRAMRDARRDSMARAGAALDLLAATRRCPACGSTRVRPHLAVCRRETGPFGLPRTVSCAGCEACGVLFSSPQPTAAAIAAMYSPGGEWSAEHAATNSVRKEGPLVRLLDRHINLRRTPGTARVLDVGCGAGRWLNTFAEAGWQTYGIEPSTKAAFTRHRELQDIPADSTFDLIILHHVLEHVARPGEMLAQCGRALTPGGWLFLSVPNLSGLPHHRDWYYCLNGKAHITAYTYEALQHLLDRAGLVWHTCLDEPQAIVERRDGTGRTRVLARKPSAGEKTFLLSDKPLDAAIAALQGAGVACDITSAAPATPKQP